MSCIIVSPSSILPRTHTLRLVGTLQRRCLQTSPAVSAIPLSSTHAGPPPTAPLPAASQYGERVDRRRRQAELIKRGQDLRTSQMKPGSAMKKRFWKDVAVRTNSGTPYDAGLLFTEPTS